MNQKRFQKIRSDWRNFPSSLVWANSTAFNWVLREVVVNLIRKQICLHSYLADANVGKSSPFLAILSPVSLKIHLEENNHKKKHHLLLLWKPQNPFGNETNAASYDMMTLVAVSGQAWGGHYYNTVAEESWSWYRGLLAVTIWYNWLE